MQLDVFQKTIVSNFGWVGGGSLSTFDVDSGREARVQVDNAKALSLHDGAGDHFAIVHHVDGRRVEITVHRFERIDAPVARATIDR